MGRRIISVCLALVLLTSGLIFIPVAKPQSVESVAAGAKPSVAVILAKIRARGVARPSVIVSGTGFLVADGLGVKPLLVPKMKSMQTPKWTFRASLPIFETWPSLFSNN